MEEIEFLAVLFIFEYFSWKIFIFFKYSREEGTRAYNFENQIDEKTKEDRLQIASQIQFEIQDKIHDDFIGKTLDVLIDEVYDKYSVGRYYGQCPQIDGIVLINEVLNIGQFYKIKITQKSDYDLIGERIWIFQTKFHLLEYV